MSKNLSDFTDEELQKELKKRKAKQSIKPRKDITLAEYEAFAQQIRDDVANAIKTGEEPKDWQYYIFEDLMHLLYGNDFFDKWNKLNIQSY